MTRPKLVLASASPRRSECLKQLGLKFVISPADISEQLNPGESSSQYVERLSREKATKVQGECPGAIVIGGDTIVWTGKRSWENLIMKNMQLRCCWLFLGKHIPFLVG